MTLNYWAERIHTWAEIKGFWPEGGGFQSRNFAEMVALSHSELSEALEAHRDGEPAVWYRHTDECLHAPLNDLYDLQAKRSGCSCSPKTEGWATEYVDTIIRILDTLGAAGVDVDEILERKMAFNDTRPHKHGKAY